MIKVPGAQLRTIWDIPNNKTRDELKYGKHPTQKPLALLTRIIMASTQQGEWILDPFTGSSTTGIAANLLGRRFLGIDQEQEYIAMSKQRREEIEDTQKRATFRSKIKDICISEEYSTTALGEPTPLNYVDLPF